MNKRKTEQIINFAPLLFLGFLFLFVFPNITFAHPGNTDSSGGHTCWTNCASWGYYYGEYHYHSGGGSTYNPPSYSTPSCPYNSSYDSFSGSCKCYSGYVASGGSCISGDSYCWNKYGYGADYDYLSKSCECGYGYVWGTDFLGDPECVSTSRYCTDNYGLWSRYNSLTDKCECTSGYVMGENFLGELSCVSGDTYCRDKYGYNSEYQNYSDACVCKDGYEFKGNECLKSTPDVSFFSPTTVEPGDTITVFGENFGDFRGDVILNTLSFGTLGRISSFNINSWSDTTIKFTVSEDQEEGNYYIIIQPSLSFEKSASSTRLSVIKPEPFIYSVSPLEVAMGDRVVIGGENFGDTEYGDLSLYVGFTRIWPGEIISWWDSEITFYAPEELESGNVILQNGVYVVGPYLTVLQEEEEQPVFFPIFRQEPLPTTQQNTTQEQKQPKEINEESQPVSTLVEKAEEVEQILEEEPGEQEDSDLQEEQPSELEEAPSGNFFSRFLKSIKGFFSKIF